MPAQAVRVDLLFDDFDFIERTRLPLDVVL
jgi:hypothetical protein